MQSIICSMVIITIMREAGHITPIGMLKVPNLAVSAMFTMKNRPTISAEEQIKG